jgi:hypothetical protein
MNLAGKMHHIVFYASEPQSQAGFFQKTSGKTAEARKTIPFPNRRCKRHVKKTGYCTSEHATFPEVITAAPGAAEGQGRKFERKPWLWPRHPPDNRVYGRSDPYEVLPPDLD